MAEWVYADPHFGHANIITYAQRPFPNVDKMDGELVKLYNSVVGKNDTVYWLGDVTLRAADKVHWLQRIVGKMNGTKILIFGNHDRWHWERYLDVGFQSVHSYLELYRPHSIAMIEQGYDAISLAHDPAWAQNKVHHNLWITGHLHNAAFLAPSHIAVVSVELTEYKPVLLNDIINGLRPGGDVPRTGPRPNREPEDWRNGKEENP